MDYCINKTVSICNNLFNYCINLCLQDNACYCQCIDDDANYNKLCVYNNAVNINLLIFIIFASCLSCITCYCIKLGIYKRHDFKKKPEKYCGTMITDTPLKD